MSGGGGEHSLAPWHFCHGGWVFQQQNSHPFCAFSPSLTRASLPPPPQPTWKLHPGRLPAKGSSAQPDAGMGSSRVTQQTPLTNLESRKEFIRPPNGGIKTATWLTWRRPNPCIQ